MELLELVAQILFGVYGEIICALIPDKTFGKRQALFFRALTLLVAFGGIITFIIGLCMLYEKDATGIPLTAVGGSLLFVHLIAFIACAVIKHKKKKAEELESAFNRDNDKTTI